MKRAREGGSARLRCAVYTRKSTEEGLEQAFNTLDAQREACEAYVRSQAGEGWTLIPEHYDDGGYSGGNTDRPALQRLLAQVDARKVDVIVVYKVDRLTRSLLDFARIVDRLDAANVSFVSVTQAFNTTTSMGRLTLNVLLSFAQFEREVTGERIRDKIAASKAKGMWMGGNVPLGYDLGERILLVNEAEADLVRHIFRRYLELGSGPAVARDLEAAGMRSKHWTARSGRVVGGVPFRPGALYYILQNRLYLGEVVHRHQRFAGDHPAVVSDELFEAVQIKLSSQRRARRSRPTRAATCNLAGRVFDGQGQPMKPSFSYGRGGKQYRYYVAPPPERTDGSRPKRVSATGLERAVRRFAADVLGGISPPEWPRICEIVRRVELHDRSIHILIDWQKLAEPHKPVVHVIGRIERAGRVRVVEGEGSLIRAVFDRKPIFHGGQTEGSPVVDPNISDPKTRLLLKSAHRLLADHSASPLVPDEHISASAPPYQRTRRIMSVGLLAPTLQRAIMRGGTGLPADLLLASDLPLAWSDQIHLFDRGGQG